MGTQEEIIALIEATSDPEKRKELSRLRKLISKEADRLIDEDLDAATQDYKEAAIMLKEASDMTRKAIADVTSVQKAINNLAAVVNLVSKVAAV